MKRCTKCGRELPEQDFRVRNKTTGARQSWCRFCQNAATRRWNKRNRDRITAAKRRWEAKNPEMVRAQKRRTWLLHRDTERAWRAANPDKMRTMNRSRHVRRVANGKDAVYKYGISPEEIEALRIAQDNRCAMCDSEFPETPPGGKRAWHIDHDHSCCPQYRACRKCIRGLLCSTCNLGLGRYEALKDRAEVYLARSRPLAA